ncbi:hypothetical protein AXG93_2551s1020 [Marchantia polymorpha subsp. ruderalis]|uniref:Integrase catalytic domain-containing protein n=1 Tax=Marchantia polymorpha subsp. ruderalis TaxID=1480154 RepID=A0A176VDR2_MARPO|nr:hypothetical protein AXG93_2551s1020 [Marchantia polymorpha subsp. ruderalis]
MVEARATRRDDAATVAAFLFESIITRYGCPLELVSDRGTHFLNQIIEDLTRYFHIKHRKTTPYNPKANGLTEKSNGLLCKILLKRMGAEESQLYRLQEVTLLDERRRDAEDRTRKIQLRRKERYDKKIKPVLLQAGDLALLYDSRHARFPGKLHLMGGG